MLGPDIRKQLEQTLRWEDEFLLKYDSDSVWLLLESMGEPKFSRVKKLLTENLEDTEKHRMMLKEVLDGDN